MTSVTGVRRLAGSLRDSGAGTKRGVRHPHVVDRLRTELRFGLSTPTQLPLVLDVADRGARRTGSGLDTGTEGNEFVVLDHRDGALGKIGRDLTLLAQSEIGEAV